MAKMVNKLKFLSWKGGGKIQCVSRLEVVRDCQAVHKDISLRCCTAALQLNCIFFVPQHLFYGGMVDFTD